MDTQNTGSVRERPPAQRHRHAPTHPEPYTNSQTHTETQRLGRGGRSPERGDESLASY